MDDLLRVHLGTKKKKEEKNSKEKFTESKYKEFNVKYRVLSVNR